MKFSLEEEFSPAFNVTLTARQDGKLIRTVKTHNIMVQGGHEWVALLLGASDLDADPPTPHVTTRPKFMGFGCGGALQTDNQFANTQQELYTVNALEDPVPVSRSGDVRTYLKQIRNQNNSTTYFPSSTRTRFICEFAETELSFAGNATRTSNVTVGTSVPVSEVGLYLSDASPTYSQPTPAPGDADPAGANSLICYNIFDPLPITPGISIRVEWELRLL